MARKKRKRKLAGAALIAHQRRLARYRRRMGRFSLATRKRRRKRRRSRGRIGGAMPRRRRRRRRGRRGSGGYGMRRLNVVLAGAGYGWLRKNHAETMAKLPFVESIGQTATHAIAAHFLAKHFRSRWLDFLATALAGHCGVEFGYADFKTDEFAQVAGDGAVVGALDL